MVHQFRRVWWVSSGTKTRVNSSRFPPKWDFQSLWSHSKALGWSSCGGKTLVRLRGPVCVKTDWEKEPCWGAKARRKRDSDEAGEWDETKQSWLMEGQEDNLHLIEVSDENLSPSSVARGRHTCAMGSRILLILHLLFLFSFSIRLNSWLSKEDRFVTLLIRQC